MIVPYFKRLICFLLLACCSGLAHYAAAQVPVGYCAQKLSSGSSGNGWWLPVCANLPLEASNTSIDTLVVAIHGLGGTAPLMLSEVEAALALIPSRSGRTLIVAPQFHEESSVGASIPDGVLFWKSFPFWGTTDQGLVGATRTSVTTTPFEAFDLLLSRIIEGGAFPNVREILIVGFSGGGQFVQRYIGVNRIVSRYALQKSISTRFLVSSPSSYLYFDAERPVSGSTAIFGLPESSFIVGCPQYNTYGTGLEGLTTLPYVSGLTTSDVIVQYANSPILYLVGELDNNPLDSSLDRGCFASIQGTNRLERAQAFYNRLPRTLGSEVLLRQELQVVPLVGHNLEQVLQSPQALTFFQIRSFVVPPTVTPNPTPTAMPTPSFTPTASPTPFFTGVGPLSQREMRAQVRILAGHVRKISRGLAPITEISAVTQALNVILISKPARKISRAQRSALKGAIRKSRSMSLISSSDVKNQIRTLSSIRWYLKQVLG